jgi:hypothetical protein
MSKTTTPAVEDASSATPTSTGASANGSITFSLRGHRGDKITSLYQLAKCLDVAVTSVFRQNLALYDFLLLYEEENLTQKERRSFDEIVRVLGLSHLVRMEGTPDRRSLVEYVKLSGKEPLCPFIANSTNTRLFLIVDRAREHAARIEARVGRNGKAHGGGLVSGEAAGAALGAGEEAEA